MGGQVLLRTGHLLPGGQPIVPRRTQEGSTGVRIALPGDQALPLQGEDGPAEGGLGTGSAGPALSAWSRPDDLRERQIEDFLARR